MSMYISADYLEGMFKNCSIELDTFGAKPCFQTSREEKRNITWISHFLDISVNTMKTLSVSLIEVNMFQMKTKLHPQMIFISPLNKFLAEEILWVQALCFILVLKPHSP